jgi:hypothetical protein
MTDLGDFGVDIHEPKNEDEPGEDSNSSSRRSYPNGRCPAINVGDRQRCSSPVSRMNTADGFCGTHGRQYESWTIHDTPTWLIKVTGSRAARCRAVKLGGDRCTNSCGPLEYYCGRHEEWPHDVVSSEELEPGELDVDRIQDALAGVQDGEDDA